MVMQKNGSPAYEWQVSTIPHVAIGLLVLNVGAFLVLASSEVHSHQVLISGALSKTAVLQQREMYRLITSMFLHKDFTHLLGNIVTLFLFGFFIERDFGHYRTLAIFFLGGLTGSVFSFLCGFSALSIGASAATTALIGAFLFHVLSTWKLPRKLWHFDVPKFCILVVSFFVGLISLSLVVPSDFTNHYSHIGGLIAGAVLAFLVGPRYVAQRVTDQNAILIFDRRPMSYRRHVLIFAYFSSLVTVLVFQVVSAAVT
jgi:membrane associated rhomboid family serine protease